MSRPGVAKYFMDSKNRVTNKPPELPKFQHVRDDTLRDSDEEKYEKMMQASSSKKRKANEEIPDQKRRLKKLKDVTNEEVEIEDRIEIDLQKNALKPKSPEKKTISYEEQAKTFVPNKLDQFRFDTTVKTAKNSKDLKGQFKFVDDNTATTTAAANKTSNMTLDKWKSKTDGMKEEKKTIQQEPAKPVKEEKKVAIDASTFFAMSLGAAKKKPVEASPKKEESTTRMEIEEEYGSKQDEYDNCKRSVYSERDDPMILDKLKISEPITKQIETKHSSHQTSSSLTPKSYKVEEKNKGDEFVFSRSKEESPIKAAKPSDVQATPGSFFKKRSSNALAGLLFVVLGEFNSTTRGELVTLLNSHGAEVEDRVTKEATALIMGAILENGEDVKSSMEYSQATMLDVKTYTEREFDEYLFQKTGKRLDPDFKETSVPTSKMSNLENNDAKNNYGSSSSTMEVEAPVMTTLSSKKGSATQDIALWATKPLKDSTAEQVQRAQQTPRPSSIVKVNPKDQLWADRHAPKNLGEVIGNQDVVRDIMAWLKDWESVVIHGNKKAVKSNSYKGRDGWDSNINAKACLISGPPGIGKTTSVRLIAKTMGYQVVEQNASDVRNKSAVEALLNHLINNTLVSFTNNKATNKKFLILMDEVDGMSSGDRGGNQVLINAIKNTKAPIVCVCNDRQHQKVRSLANHCYDLRFQKPDSHAVMNRMREIVNKEGVTIPNNSLIQLCESFGNDIRQMLTFLQMQSKSSKDLSSFGGSGKINSVGKDKMVMLDHFEATKIIMTSPHLPVREKIDLFFIDYDMIPLLVHQNYIPYMTGVQTQDLQRMAAATDMVSTGDIYSRRVRNGDWGLLPDLGFIGVVFPSEITGMNVPNLKFPEWLGKNSSHRKRKREVREIREYISPAAQITSLDVLLDYGKGLLDLIGYNLQANNKECIDAVVEIMDHYNISPEMIKENLADIQFPPSKEVLTFVSPQTKAALTKSFNSRHKSSIKSTKTKRKVGADAPAHKRYNEAEEDGGDIDDIEEDENDSEETQIEVEASKSYSTNQGGQSKGKGKAPAKAVSKKK